MAKDAVITCKIDKYKLNKRIKQHIDVIKERIIRQLSYIGEECVRIARENGSYNDITGNLRSSIGYVILNDGKVQVGGNLEAKPVTPGIMRVKRIRKDKNGNPHEYIAKIKIGGDGKDGVTAAQTLLDKMQSEFPKGIVLIVCAGMKYAAYVENIHHKDVLTSAELTAESLMKQLLNGVID